MLWHAESSFDTRTIARVILLSHTGKLQRTMRRRAFRTLMSLDLEL